MANQLARTPGDLQKVTARAAVQGVPDFAVDDGAAARVLESIGSSLSARLGRMADHAAANEGELAGMNAGQRAGEKFLQREKTGTAAEGRGGKGPADVSVRPGEASTGPADLDGTPLQLRHDNTIRGEAFDRAAVATYGWRMQEGLANDIGAAFEANSASPGGFEKAVAGVVEKYQADGIMREPEIRDLFERTLNDRLAPARLAVAANHERAVRAAAREAAVAGSEAVLHELERNAYALGANPAADELLAGSVTRAVGQIDAAVRAGTFSAKEGAAKKRAIERTVLAARTTGTFDALPSAAAKQDFAQSILSGYAEGKGPYAGLSLTEAKELSGSLYAKATAEASKLTAEAKAEKGRIETLIADDVASLAGSGEGLDAEANGLSADHVKAVLGDNGYADWMASRDTARSGWEATSGMEAESGAEIAARLDTLAPQPGQAGYADQQQIYSAAMKQANAVLKERELDPLGQAHRAGLVELKALDTTTPAALVASLQARRQQAETVAATYSTPIAFFRPEERTTLANALADNAELLPGFARAAGEALGSRAPAALAELSDAAPELIHAVGLATATGDNSVADDVARVIGARKAGTFKAKMPTDNVLGDAAGRELGDVFAFNDNARAAVIGTANFLFEKEANTLGFDAGSVNKDGSAAQAAYRRAVDRALGARLVGDVQYGGLDEVNGGAIVAPSFMPRGRAEDLLSGLSDTELAFLPAIASANGVAVTAAQLRQARLVTIGDGVYRVALGDPSGLDPRFVAAADGGYWQLDLQQLEQLRALPEYRRPGSTPPDVWRWVQGQISRADAP